MALPPHADRRASLNPARWVQIEELFHRVIECDADGRVQLLEHAANTDTDLRREVESLLACHVGADGHLRAAVREEAGAIDSSGNGDGVFVSPSALTDALAGAVIGPYHLVELIGQGGMGEVWLAEQKQPVRRCVALKLIKAGMDTHEVVARFESERQALALMDHPAIAKVFDAGSTQSGRPYFVMEFVPGMPVTDYCNQHTLSVPERLQLFIQVCEAVQHAHQKAIIHRDLKPSNILVTDIGGKPRPNIIDFGVAKAISQALTENALVTRVGALLGTPEYMSPEQANSAGEDIDTRTDVYSLGVILYELLVGTLPLDLRKLRFDEMLRKLRADDPCPPSTRLRSLREQSQTTAQNRRTEPKALARQLHGDLDSIVLQALDKDRSRRYGSPSELAADIERYLQHKPVAARPASARYRAWKYARRHRVGVGFAAALTLLLVAGVVVSSWMAIRASRAEQEARAVNDFLRNDVLAQASVDEQTKIRTNKPDPNLKVRTALDRAAARIPGKFGKQPLVEASIRYTIGGAYYDLNLYSQAQRQFERVLDLRRTNLGAENQDTLLSKWALGLAYRQRGNYSNAEKVMIETLAAQRRVLGSEHPNTLTTEHDLALIHLDKGEYSEAEKLDREVLSRLRLRLGENHPITLEVENGLIASYELQGKYAEAEPMNEKLVNAMLRLHGAENRDTLLAMSTLAMLYGFENKLFQSEALYRRVVDGLTRLEGKEDEDTLASSLGLAQTYNREGKYAQADTLFSEILQIETRVLGKDHPYTLSAMSDLAASYRRRGMYSRAESLLVAALEGARRKLGSANPYTLATMGDLGWVYVNQARYARAEAILREASNQFEKTGGDDWERYRVLCALGASLSGQKQYAKAEPLLINGYREMRNRRPSMIAADPGFELQQAGEQIVKLYTDWGKPEKASEWRGKLKQVALSISPKRA